MPPLGRLGTLEAGEGSPVSMAIGDEDRADDDVKGGAEQVGGHVHRGRSRPGHEEGERREGTQGERISDGPSPPNQADTIRAM